MLTKKGVIVNIFNSYSTPFINYIKIFLTNGLIIYDGKEMLYITREIHLTKKI